MFTLLRPVLTVVLFNTLAFPTFAAVTNDQATNVGIQRSFVNLDFSQPTISPQYLQLPQESIPGWRTTHRFWGNVGRIIEIWRGAGHESSGGMPNASTDQYAELNAEEAAALYQKVCLFKNENFSWSFQHAARTTSTETAEFLIGNVADQVGGNATYAVTSVQSIATSSVTRRQSGRWVTRSGTATVSSSVPEKGGIYSFIFRATNGSTLGNFLDNIVLNLKPAVEFSTSNGQYFENNPNKLPVAFKIVGQINKAADMPKLNFSIAYNSSTPLAKRPVYGTDYRLYKRVGQNYVALSGSDTLNIDSNQNVSFSYTPDYISNLDYTQGVEVNGLAIELIDNHKIEGDKTLPFSFQLDSSSRAIVASMKTCSQGTANYDFDFIIRDNDTDLKIVKTTIDPVTQKPTERMFYPNERISYHLDVSNNSILAAENVRLNDQLRSNLSYDANTSLRCEALTDKSSCPILPSNAVDELFNNGLNIGTLAANSQLRFHLSNLKTTAQDQSPQESLALIHNNASVSTDFNDIAPEDNSSEAKNRYAAGSDLFNLDSTQSGTGLFVIEKNGNALWQKPALQQFVYFPLAIQNSSQISQDYQLYASRREIEKTLAHDGRYGSLINASIEPYTEQLKIEFFQANKEQCQAGLVQQAINQVTIAAQAQQEICAVVQVLPSAQPVHSIWFAISSSQFGLADIIRNEVTSTPIRQLELVNDQTAQVELGGTYVFKHRLFNRGQMDEHLVQFQLIPQKNDGFLYRLFIDANNNGLLDDQDTALEHKTISLLKSTELALLIKVEAPANTTYGTQSQVQLMVIPNNNQQAIVLANLFNTDTITVSPNQLEIVKSQLKAENCPNLSKSNILAAHYSAQNISIKPQDCLIYQIRVKNIGSSPLYNVTLHDSYPAYTQPWTLKGLLPMSNSEAKISHTPKNVQVNFLQLNPNEEKSMFFGIKVN